MPMIALALLAMVLQDAGSPSGDAARLIGTIESLQEPLKDFRCEFEGTTYYKGKIAEREKVDPEKPADLFRGLFIWKRGGDLHAEILHQRQPDGVITRESVLLRAGQGEAEQYSRLNDEPVGMVWVRKPEEVLPSFTSILGRIFLIDEFKRLSTHEAYSLSVSDDEIEGRPLKVLNIGLKDLPDVVTGRYWIDLGRSGHVVRAEAYWPDKTPVGRLDIKLELFQVGDAEVWMPVSGEDVGYAALENGTPVLTKEPTSHTTINVLRDTLAFNKYPGPDVFTIKYKPGAPISNELRAMRHEFEQQGARRGTTGEDAKQDLDEQLALAESQNRVLVAHPASESFPWLSALAWTFGAAAVVSLVALMVQRRGR